MVGTISSKESTDIPSDVYDKIMRNQKEELLICQFNCIKIKRNFEKIKLINIMNMFHILLIVPVVLNTYNGRKQKKNFVLCLKKFKYRLSDIVQKIEKFYHILMFSIGRT